MTRMPQVEIDGVSQFARQSVKELDDVFDFKNMSLSSTETMVIEIEDALTQRDFFDRSIPRLVEHAEELERALDDAAWRYVADGEWPSLGVSVLWTTKDQTVLVGHLSSPGTLEVLGKKLGYVFEDFVAWRLYPDPAPARR